MEGKVRYQYSYFIYPFTVENYETYLQSLLLDKKWKLELPQKEKDIELYTYFLPTIRDYFLPSMDWEERQKKQWEEISVKGKAKKLGQMGACYFSYELEQQIHGKMGQGDLFFTIDTIQIVCTKPNNCFLLVKTHIENVENIEQVLDFNYKFREINLVPETLKSHEKICIQTTQFEATKEVQELIQELTNQEKITLPYVHSYVCMDSEDWNSPSDFERLQSYYKKYIHLKPKQANDIPAITEYEVMDSDYIKMAVTQEGNFIMASSIQNENYTKLPYLFEKQYLYTYLIRMQQKERLGNCFEQSYEKMEKWESIVARDEITKEEDGIKFYQVLRKIWDFDKLEKRAREYYQMQLQKNELKRNKKWNRILGIVLAISILLNLYNLVINMSRIMEGI